MNGREKRKCVVGQRSKFYYSGGVCVVERREGEIGPRKPRKETDKQTNRDRMITNPSAQLST